jgi:hypothetical protein
MARAVHHLAIGTLLCSLPLVLTTRLFSNTTIPPGLTRDCIDALLVDVGCNSSLLGLQAGSYYSKSILEGLCTPGCSTSLGDYATNVEKHCADETWSGYGDENMPIAIITDLLQYEMTRACITDSGRFCNNVAASAAYAANPTSKFRPSQRM